MLPGVRLATILLTTLAANAQCPPGPRPPAEVASMTAVPNDGPAAVRLRAGIDALKGGDAAAARSHLLAALEFHPAAPAILLELLLANANEPAGASQWAERLVRAASDGKGKFELPPDGKKRLAAAKELAAPLKTAHELTAVRASAIAETARYIERMKASGKQNGAKALLVRWASDVLLALGEGAPLPLFAVAPAVTRVQDGFTPDYDVVYPALGKLLAKVSIPSVKPPTNGAAAPPAGAGPVAPEVLEDRRVRAARILLGLQRQSQYDKLFGPKPQEIGHWADQAEEVLASANEAAVAADKVWTVDELAALSPADADRFTNEHATWRRPGLATSPNGRYRIETICGHGTLLGVARTIELHHARIADWFGADPFAQRQGIVRIVPEVGDLDSEGSPFWWAGGFQSGDHTTVRFAWGDIPAIGRTLTHELTHRFQGVLRSFAKPWYAEGTADWTGAHYGRMAETKFTENYLDRGAVDRAWRKGYGERDKLEQLLNGELEEYRDNYFAGYALFAFLRSYPPDAPRYAEVLPGYEKNLRGGQNDPIGYFTAAFCDGKKGRPKDLDGLLAEWQTFLRGVGERLDERSRNASNEWVERYDAKLAREAGSLVMDPPTWSWARNRAEPFFGQEHAAAATLLLHEAGVHDATIAAGVWSLSVDGWRLDTCAAILASLRATAAHEAAAAFAVVAGRHFPSLAPIEAAPLQAALPKAKQLIDALATAAATVPMLAAERDALARLLALPPAAGDIDPTSFPAPTARHFGGYGYTEDSLTDYDDRRHAGLWYATPEGDLHVGREKPREGTGTLDREAHQRDAFVRTVEWFAPGEYVLRGRVHLTTSYVSGAFIIGHGRRDRSVRLFFSSGDFDYATGRNDAKSSDGRIEFRLDGRWERDGRLPDSKRNGSTALVGEGAFDFVVHVRGPRLVVTINDDLRLSYSSHDAAPLEGPIGFAMSMGAIRVQQPVIQRRDGGALIGLDLAGSKNGAPVAATGAAVELASLMSLPVRGLPLAPDGAFVLWIPPTADDSAVTRLGRALLGMSKLMTTPHEYPQAWLLAVPKGLSADGRARAVKAIADVRGSEPAVIEHAFGAPLDGPDAWVLFVDSEGVLRAAAGAGDVSLHTKVGRWARMFRSR
jgi:hypothetical protein